MARFLLHTTATMYPKHRYPLHKSRKPITPNHKAHAGPGGINCPCCTRLEPTAFKRLTRRLERVFLKRDLQHQLSEI